MPCLHYRRRHRGYRQMPTEIVVAPTDTHDQGLLLHHQKISNTVFERTKTK